LSLLSARLASTTREPKKQAMAKQAMACSGLVSRTWQQRMWQHTAQGAACSALHIAALHRDDTIVDLQALAPLESSTLFVCCVMRTATQLLACPNFE
jgi:hypothetical protein